MTGYVVCCQRCAFVLCVRACCLVPRITVLILLLLLLSCGHARVFLCVLSEASIIVHHDTHMIPFFVLYLLIHPTYFTFAHFLSLSLSLDVSQLQGHYS